MTSSKKTWISIAIAAVIIATILAAGAVGGTIVFFSRHISAQSASSERASEEFARARARFAEQQPLIELNSEGRAVLRSDGGDGQSKARPARQLQTLHVLMYKESDRKLMRIEVPFWLLRMAPRGRVRFRDRHRDEDPDIDFQHSQVTIADLERHGPGLVLDSRDRRGDDVLVWTE